MVGMGRGHVRSVWFGGCAAADVEKEQRRCIRQWSVWGGVTTEVWFGPPQRRATLQKPSNGNLRVSDRYGEKSRQKCLVWFGPPEQRRTNNGGVRVSGRYGEGSRQKCLVWASATRCSGEKEQRRCTRQLSVWGGICVCVCILETHLLICCDLHLLVIDCLASALGRPYMLICTA